MPTFNFDLPHIPAQDTCPQDQNKRSLTSVRVRRWLNSFKEMLPLLRPPIIAFSNSISVSIDDYHSGDAFTTQWRMPANFIAEVGTLIEMELWGRYYSVPTGVALSIEVDVGVKVALTKASTSFSENTGIAQDFHIQGSFLVTAAGSGGSMRCEGQSAFKQTGGPLIEMLALDPPDVAVNFTKQNTWRVRPIWTPANNAFVSITLDQMIFKVWPPAGYQDSILVQTFALDNFVEAADLSLASHTMDAGYGWTHVSGSGGTLATVQGGKGRVKMDQNGNSGHMVWSTNTDFSDGTFYHTVLFDSGGSNAASDAGGCFRIYDTSNYVIATVLRNANPALAGFAIYQNVAGVFTRLAYDAFTPADDVLYNIVTTLAGNSMVTSVNGRPALAATLPDTLHPTHTAHGLRYAGGTVNSYGYYYAQFKGSYP